VPVRSDVRQADGLARDTRRTWKRTTAPPTCPLEPYQVSGHPYLRFERSQRRQRHSASPDWVRSRAWLTTAFALYERGPGVKSPLCFGGTGRACVRWSPAGMDAGGAPAGWGCWQALGADHRYIPLLMTAPGIGWVTGFTIAAEIGEINRFSSPVKLTGYTGLCPRVNQSGEMDRRGPLSEARPALLALGADGGRDRGVLAPARQGALPAHQAPTRSPARREGRPDRARQKADRGDLVAGSARPTAYREQGRSFVSNSRPRGLQPRAPDQRCSTRKTDRLHRTPGTQTPRPRSSHSAAGVRLPGRPAHPDSRREVT
jgi:hypothetical protein